MNEIFWKIFQLRLSDWEAEFIATFVAQDLPLPDQFFEAETVERMRDGIVRLAALPRGWRVQLTHTILERKVSEGGSYA